MGRARARALTFPAETSTKTRPGFLGRHFPRKSVQTTVNNNNNNNHSQFGGEISGEVTQLCDCAITPHSSGEFFLLHLFDTMLLPKPSYPPYVVYANTLRGIWSTEETI